MNDGKLAQFTPNWSSCAMVRGSDHTPLTRSAKRIRNAPRRDEALAITLSSIGSIQLRYTTPPSPVCRYWPLLPGPAGLSTSVTSSSSGSSSACATLHAADTTATVKMPVYRRTDEDTTCGTRVITASLRELE